MRKYIDRFVMGEDFIEGRKKKQKGIEKITILIHLKSGNILKNKQNKIEKYKENKKSIQKAKKLSLENKLQTDKIKTRKKPGTKKWRGKEV